MKFLNFIIGFLLLAQFATAQFTPTISSFSPSSGPVGTPITINGTYLDFNPVTVTIGGTNAIVIPVSSTQIAALVMPGTPTGPITITTGGGTVSSTTGFTVTASRTPNTQQGAKLVGSGSAGSSAQGWSLALSGDGNTAIVGGYADNLNMGAAWIYTRSGGVWSQQGTKLVASGTTSAPKQGYAVSISADGNTAILGAPYNNFSEGGAWVFTRSGGVWTQQGSKLLGTGTAGTASQGTSVSLSADGNTALIGGPTDNAGLGAVWIFTRNSGVWTQQGSKLAGTGNTGSIVTQGTAAALSADGNTAIVGGYQDNSNQGAAWIFTRSGGVWTQQGSKLVGTGNSGAAQQGYAVALSADGNTAVIGGNADNSNQGAAWVFTRSGGVWSQQGSKLTGTGNTGASQQGYAVSISADGNTMAMGGQADNSNQGAAWIFTRSGGAWTQSGSILTGTGNSGAANQGAAVAISADGNTAMVGGFNDNGGLGAVWSYVAHAPAISSFSPSGGPVGSLVTINGSDLSAASSVTIGGAGAIIISNTSTKIVAMVMPGAISGNISVATANGNAASANSFTVVPATLTNTQQGGKLLGTGGAGLEGYSVAISADGNTAIVGGLVDNGSQGAAWIFTRTAGVWSQQGSKLVGTGNAGPANQGRSVALSADGNTAIIGGPSDNSSQGAAWVFTRNGSVWTQQGAKLVGTGNMGAAMQGTSVSISADGNTAISGGVADNSNQGAVWVFVRSNTGAWSQQGAKLTGSGSFANGYVGWASALSADGNTIIAGGYGDTFNTGAAWIFTNNSGVWSQQGSKLTGTGNAGNAQQGYSVSISADGNTAMIGGYQDNSAQGAAWVFTRSAGVWTQQGPKLTGTGNIGAAQQGYAVSLSADGNTALIGGNQDNSGQGAAWIFTRSAGTWSQQGTKLTGTGNAGPAQQGGSVAVSADGNTAIVGGPQDNGSAGAAWVYALMPPAISSFSPATGSIGTPVTITGTNLNNASLVTIGGVNAIIISNTGTQLVAMVMPGASSGNISITTFGGTATSASAFTVVPNLVPNAQQGAKLVGTGNSGPADQGWSVALSADGNTAVVGGYADNSNQGAAWMYTRSGGVWSQQGTKLLGTGNTGAAQQGYSVAISADGNTAIIGAPADNSNQGASWIFTRTGGVWTQQGTKLVGSGNTGAAKQGAAVSISADGNTAVIGGPDDNAGQGAVWVFTRSGLSWTQQGAKLAGTGSTGATVNQGYAVALSADGNTIIVGGYQDNSGQGAAWVYARALGVWTQQGAKLTGTANAGAAQQGYSVSLSADGNTAAIGGLADNSNQGATWVFTRSAGVWTQQGSKLTGTGNTGAANQGKSVVLSADGNTLIASGPADNSNVGAAWMFTRNGTAWTQSGGKLTGSGTIGTSYMGKSACLSADGNTALMGGPADNSVQGAAWAFVVLPPTISSFTPASGPVGSLVTVTGTNLSSPTSVIIGGVSAVVISNTGTQLVALVMPGAVTGQVSISTLSGTANSASSFAVIASQLPNLQQGSKLVGTGNTGSAYQGTSIAVSADGNTAIVGGFWDNSFQGAAWVFVRTGSAWSQQGTKLVGSGASGAANQGRSVAISADGNTALVGGEGDASGQGAAWVFTRSGGVWTQQGPKLVGSGGIGTAVLLGHAAALSADGNTAILGGSGDNAGQGAAWVFTRTGGVWTQQGSKLVGTGSIGAAGQGNSVSVNADGNTVIIGGSADNSSQGAAWVFTRSAGTWTQQGSKLVGTGNTGAAEQGFSVAVSADGNTAILGGDQDNAGAGAAWVFTRSGAVWTQQGTKLVGTGILGGFADQGYSVSLSADGNTAIVGGYYDNAQQGAAWLFTRSGGVWTQQGKQIGTGNIGAARQGRSVAMSADGNTALVGGDQDNANIGAAWVFRNGALLPVQLLAFTGNRSNNTNHIQWTTADEINTKEFVLERSMDGVHFGSVATLRANGTGTGSYSYEDGLIFDGLVYYRLKIVDNDGSYTYSGIIKFSSHPVDGVSVYPNPVQDQSTLQVNDHNLLGTQVTITDANGRTVQTFVIKNYVETINMHALPSGLYLLRTANGYSVKLIKQ